IRVEQVVAVGEGEVLASRARYPSVPGRPEALVLLLDKLEPRIAGSETFRNDRASVGGAIVDHDDLEVAQGLPGDRLKRRLDITLHVVEWHDNAELCHVRQHLRRPRNSLVRITKIPETCDVSNHAVHTVAT